MQAPLTGGGPVRVSPQEANARNIVALQDLPPEKAEKKLREIHDGGSLMMEHRPLPDHRACQDCCFILLFAIAAIGIMGTGYLYSGKLVAATEHQKDTNLDGVEFPPQKIILMVSTAGLAGSLIFAYMFTLLAHRAPTCVVWTSLIFGPAFAIISGLVLIGLASNGGGMMLAVMGFIMVALGICQLACVCCCWMHLIPFMVKLTEVVADVIEDHPCMMVVSSIGAFFGLLWTLLCGVAFVGLYMENEEVIKASGKYGRYVVIFVSSLLFSWGTMIAGNVCHVIYCGVFARWYFKGESERGTLTPSITAALTTSFGSVCFGSLLVALVRALEAVARACKNDAYEEGNYVTCVLACLLECIISCIGDVLEYFNEWAYVQCAVRGTSFIQSAKITYSMVTCANVEFIMRDLLLNSLVTLGGFICAVAGAASGAGTGYALDGVAAATVGGVIGFFVGLIAGFAALGVINSGIKTILMCWAEDDRPLQQTHPEIHEEFVSKIRQNC